MSSVRVYARVFLGFAALALLTAISALTLGCGGGAVAPPITVSITTTPGAMVAGGTQTFTVTVANDPNFAGVTWVITSGGGKLSAVTATSATYTAPTPVTTATAVITVTSKSDTTKTYNITIPLTPISVTINNTTLEIMAAGATQQFSATVSADITPSAGVTWTASVGTITASGLYTAPTPVTTATAVITATSKTDPSKTVTITVTLTPISVAITTTPVPMVAGATQTFAATVSNDITPSAGVTWSASVGAITAAGVYTAPTPVGAATAIITATSKTDPTKSASVTVPLTPIAVTITPTAPVAMIAGATQTFTANLTGDITPSAGVTWSASTGPTITAAGVYTAPTPVGAATAIITATSKTDPTKSASVTVPLTPISVAAISPATISLGTSTAENFTGATVSNDIAPSAGVTWSISPNTANVDGTINSSTGAYTAPTGVISAVTTVTVTATSNTDHSKTATATITLQPIAVAAVTPATVSLNGGGTQTFTGAALTYDGTNSGVTWSISPASGAGTIVSSTGVYTAPAVVSGTSPVTVTVTAASVKDPNQKTTATVTLNPIAISFTTTTTGITLDSGQTLALAAAVSNDASASGANFNTSGAGSVSPLSATGNAPATTLTATGTTASTVTVTATSAKDGTKTATTSSITVNPAITFSPASGALTAAQTNTAYPGATIAASGGTGTKTFALANGTTLPGNLTLNPTTGAISGTITVGAGTYTFAVKVTDTATTPVTVTSGNYTITVTAAPLAWINPSVPVTLPAATVGTAITPQTLSTSGGTGAVTYSIASGTLPAGLSLNPATGVVSGTPTAPTPTTGNVITFRVTDSASPTPATSISPAVTVIVNPVTLVVNTPTLPSGFVGLAYNGTGYQFTSAGGTGTITWTMSPSTVDGLTLSSTGLLHGTPTATFGPATISVTATDSATNQQQTKTITPSLTVSNALTVTTTQSTLPNAYTGQAYPSTTLAASGGSGSGYTWTVTAGASTLSAINLSLSSAGVITGTPSATGTANFTVQVTDSASHTATQTYSITAYVPLALPTPNPNSLGSATTTAQYSGSIVATGGVSVPNGYTWNVNGTNVITTPVSLGNGTMQASSNGEILNITGTPTTTGTISFIVKVTDSAGTTVGPSASTTYTIAVSANYSVGGNINLNNNCNVSTLPTFTLNLTNSSSTVVGTATSDNNGNFSIANIPNGTYTLTPSISGPSSVFYPATQSVTVNNGNITGSNFGVNLGYTVSGTVAYTGTQTEGNAYLVLTNTTCGGGTFGTFGAGVAYPFTGSGAYVIQGVPPGSYTLQAFMDPSSLGKGNTNAVDPTGSNSVTVNTANVTGANVTLADPGTVTLTTAPTLSGVAPFNNGVFASYKPITNSNGVEMATSYTLQWSTTSTFTAIAGSQTFPANGTNTNVWFTNSATSPTLTNGGTFYFRAYGTSAGTAQSAFSSVFGPVTIGPNTTGSTVSGSVTFVSTSPNGTASGPMYAGLYNNSTGVFYGQYIASPVNAQAYTVTVPNSSTAVYQPVAIIDQNNDGIIDAGDLQNANNHNGSSTLVAVTGNTTGVNQTLPSGSSTARVTTQNTQSTSSNGTSQNYGLTFQVSGLLRQPVAVIVSPGTPLNADGANVIPATGIAVCTGGNNGCGQGFQFSVSTAGVSPTAGDVYEFLVTYSSGPSGITTNRVSSVLTAFATNLSPAVTSSSLTPSFSWTDPANASNYTYSFYLNPTTGGNTIWQIPGNNSNSNGFSSTITSIPTWGTDPTGGGSTPTSSLNSGTSYTWQIQLQDSNGNQATQQTYFVTP